MKVKEMIKENNKLREQMTPFNRSYYEDMLIGMRASRVDTLQAEELLLDAAKLLLDNQAKGKNAKQVFGEHPGDYFREMIDNAPVPPARSQLNYYLMIPWTALTAMFGVMAIAGLILQWSTGSPGVFDQISLFTIILVGAGSIVVIELIMKWMASLSDEDHPAPAKFDIKGFGVYIGIAVVAIFAAMFLDSLFPVITVSPWVSLLIAIGGGIGLKLIFLNK